MITYNDLYEVLRKEKYSDVLQPLPKKFIDEFATYLAELRESSSGEQDIFADSLIKVKKQMENSIAIFKELTLRRKKKLLNLVFVAAETGIMKRDYENMLSFEREIFDKFVKAIEDGDKDLNKMLMGSKDKTQEKNRLVMFKQDVEEFMSMDGNMIGPFKSGELANIDSQVADILVQGGKANYIDE